MLNHFKKKVRRLFSGLLAFVLVVLTLPASEVFAQSFEQTTQLRLAIGDPTYMRNGIVISGESAPFIDPTYNRTMVPLRIVAEALGADVGWI